MHTVSNFDFIFFDDYPLNMHKVFNEETALNITLQSNRFFMFVDICLDWHMQPGAVLSAYLQSSTTKLEDTHFKRLIIDNPKVLYTEKIIDIEVPENCNYFKGYQDVIPIIRRAGV